MPRWKQASHVHAKPVIPALLLLCRRTKITLGQREAAEKEANLHSAETQAATSKARLAAYNAALQEVCLLLYYIYWVLFLL